jgi:hypothetical protein
MKVAVRMDAYETYQKYLALKTHFKSDKYDYFRYHGKLKGDRARFEVRKDKYSFHKISKMRHPEDYMVANFLVNSNFWSGDVNDEKSLDIYNEWVRRRDSRTYLFKNEIEGMDDDFDSNIMCKLGEHPRLLVLYLRKVISPETLIILDKLVNHFRYWNKYMANDLIWPDEYKKLNKYTPFFMKSVDLGTYKSIIVDKFKDKS